MEVKMVHKIKPCGAGNLLRIVNVVPVVDIDTNRNQIVIDE